MSQSKRRGRGEGSISRRPDGLWRASFSAGYDANGKRLRREVYGKTKAEAREKLNTARAATLSGQPVQIQRLTIADYLNRWLKSTLKDSVAPTTYDRYKVIVDHQIIPHLGGMQVVAVQPVHIEQFYGQLAEVGSSARTRQLAGIVLSSALKHAVVLKLILSNPCREIPKARVDRREMKVWDSQQVATFLATTKDNRLHGLYMAALATGLRQGELFGLQWPDIDFEAGTLSVQRSLEEIRGKVRLKEPKTAQARRRIDLPKFALTALLDHRAKMFAEGHIASQVFCAPDGGFLRKGNIYRRSFAPLMKASKLPTIRFHDLRHTHATILLAAGENVKVISERLGHASIQITLDTYAHVLPSMQKQAANTLQRLLG